MSHDDRVKYTRLKLTTSRTKVIPFSSNISTPMTLAAGLAMVPSIAIEARMKKLVCMFVDEI